MGLLERWARPFAGFGAWLAKLTSGVYKALGYPGRLFQDLMNGSFLGHSTHGLLTDAAVGAVTALLVLDAVAALFGADGSGFETASLVVLGFGALSAWGAVLAGLTDHKDTASGDERNMATLHGLINIVATLGYTIAFFVRLGGGVGTARWISLIAFLLLASGAFIGGHLVYKYGVMVNHNAFSGGRRAQEVTPVLPAAQPPAGGGSHTALRRRNTVVRRR